jgi:hypothetical protein
MKKMRKYTVIYITGAGGSGSTLLSMVLGAHENAVSVGELAHYDRYKALDLKCSCGERFSHCDFWSHVDSEYGQVKEAPLLPAVSQLEFLRKGDSVIKEDPHFKDVVKANLDLYDEIHKQSGKQYIIDVSKDPVRMYYLYRSGMINILPVYIVRDGRSYILSRRKRGAKSAFRSILRWMRMNIICMAALKTSRTDFVIPRISYSEFTSSPELAIQKICEYSGMEYDPAMQEYWGHQHHNIAGSAVRNAPSPIKPENTPFEKLTVLDKLLFVVLGGSSLNKKLGL